MLRIKNIDLTYPEIWRVFISGSSSSGKTHFARQLLQAKLFKQSNIIYCHPDIEEDFPTDWNDHFSNVIFECGLPNLADLLALPPYSVIVLDDLFDEAAKSKDMSYLFRVLSSKKKLHVIIMTQRYYEGGSPGLTLRNSSTHHILMNNSDARTNVRVGCSMGLKREVLKANEMNKSKLYPYIAIDRTNHARINDTQVYTDILSPVKEIVIGCQAMNIHYKHDFDKKYEIKNGFAKKRPYELDTDDDDYYPSDSDDSMSGYSSDDDSISSFGSQESINSADSNDSNGSVDNSVFGSQESSKSIDSEDESDDESEDESDDESEDESDDESGDESDNESGDESDDESEDESDDESGDESDIESGDESDDESGDESDDESMDSDDGSDAGSDLDSDADQDGYQSDTESDSEDDDMSSDEEDDQIGNGLSRLRLRGKKRSRHSSEESNSSKVRYRKPTRGFIRRSRYFF